MLQFLDMTHSLVISCAQEDVVLPARRISKSRDATPVVSDPEDAPEAADGAAAVAAAAAEADPAGKKGKLRKAGADQQDTGSAKKRRKRMSKTPEPSDAVQAPLDIDGEVRSGHH